MSRTATRSPGASSGKAQTRESVQTSETVQAAPGDDNAPVVGDGHHPGPVDEVKAHVQRQLDLLAAGRHWDPHSVLGRHGEVVRAYRPGATEMYLEVPGTAQGPAARLPMTLVHPSGAWEGELDAGAPSYRLEAVYGPGSPGFVFEDPYRFWPTLGALDLHLFNEGRHRRLWEVMGSRPMTHQGMTGTAFAVWAPNAKSVRVVGDWNFWDGRAHPMRALGSSGVWELFIPGVDAGARYKYEVLAADGHVVLKADPYAYQTEVPPATASIVAPPPAHQWRDEVWMSGRSQGDPLSKPMSVYEAHIGSWRYTDDGSGGYRPMNYRELAEVMPAYIAELGFTHVEFLPVAEHPFGGSWGYQVTGYYAPTSRYGTPDDFRALVDAFHRRNIGVIVDWVPAHFPRDEFALARFDGTELYEHAGPMGSHPDWGTLVFNLSRNEVRNFLIANALFWLEEFHVDALRVDAVASMLYLDYSRKAGEWAPNQFGGNENLEAVAFLKELNEVVFSICPRATTIAEESTSWPGVSRPTYLGGLGFGFKWNMGWMHDTLEYFQVDPLFRRYHQNDLTFGLLYAFFENFVLPFSHDEVVYGKRSMLEKMPGDRWAQLANLRALYAWMWAHPGKKMLFMGSEIGQEQEWSNERSLDWHVLEWPDHARLRHLVGELNKVYRGAPALWEQDFSSAGFRWIDASDNDQNILSFYRARKPGGAGIDIGQFAPVGPVAEQGWPAVPPADTVVCIANFSPVPQVGYRVGLPAPGRWLELLNTDAKEWGGSGLGNMGEVWAESCAWHGQAYSAEMVLPPLAVLWLTPAP